MTTNKMSTWNGGLGLLARVSLLIGLLGCGGSSGDPTPPAAPPAVPTIAAPTLAGTFQPSGAVAVSFATTGTFGAGNVFTAQLSDGTGSFASPTAIGTSGSSPISATLPSGAMTGTAYRIRVVASNPSTISPDNGVNLSIASPTISVVGIRSAQSSATTIVPGRTVLMSVGTTGMFGPGNEFTLQLSDAAGSFGSPTVLRSMSSTIIGPAYGATLPNTIPAGSSYRLRMVASNPVVTGAPSETFAVVMPTIAAPTLSGNFVPGGTISATGVPTGDDPFNPSNRYTLQLSDAMGSFASPTELITSDLPDIGTLTASIPRAQGLGAGYKMRIVSTSPPVIGAETAPFTLTAPPSFVVSDLTPGFTKMYLGSFYGFRISRTGGQLNPGTSLIIQTPVTAGSDFNSDPTGNRTIYTLLASELTALSTTGTVDIRFLMDETRLIPDALVDRSIRLVAQGNSENGHNGLVGIPIRSHRLYATRVLGYSATISGSMLNLSFTRLIMSGSQLADMNNQAMYIWGATLGDVGGSGSRLVMLRVRVPMANESIPTGNVSVSLIVDLSLDNGLSIYTIDGVSATISGTPASYTLSLTGPVVVPRVSGTAPLTSVTVENVSSTFSME